MESHDAEFSSAFTSAESKEPEKVMFRVFVKYRNNVANDGSNGHSYIVEAVNENDAVTKVLEYGDAPINFGSIHVEAMHDVTIVA
ncbi:hypothetical protein [Streptomyces griseosporeus]|uniref:hypothetical protein n=1 Tax=Streptomyces griseosporeus TaxID=1910 RepID=UPI00167CB073|nr:hypothetical protein [Streptomyces griseosporeus]GHF92366.1 hypothetical protein GCM10018783_74080 [Streptomyces griseosporeus]